MFWFAYTVLIAKILKFQNCVQVHALLPAKYVTENKFSDKKY